MLNLFRATLYLRLQAERLRILHVESGRTLETPPLLAMARDAKGQHVLAAAGKAALAMRDQQDIELVNGFAHPRSLLANFNHAARTLQWLLGEIQPKQLLRPAPLLVIHPLEHLEGGLTQIEIRALAELGLGSGAHQVFVWTGRELQRHELENLHFPSEGGHLLWPG